MAAKKEDSREVQKFEFQIRHADIVDMMNDADVQLDNGNVLSTQVFQVHRIKANGTEISLQELGSGDTIVFRFNKVVIVDDPTVFNDIDVT